MSPHHPHPHPPPRARARSISRYHNPDNYTAALGRIIFLKRRAEGQPPLSWLRSAYARSLGLEAAEAAGLDPAEALLAKPWDSSDADGDALPPAVGMVRAAAAEAPW